ncbi:hypothetical protein R3Q06_33205 [Rhodococcus erythropolis]|uniref:terpene synthase family protein n=1 Tax=Rhodococcus erythropolis TaxID=1833 RepID=UPI00294932AF|nr:hypothetical protein [Rhodococcus erythropolis]MDV6278304.1 hypothetical protein [Rhodococcus erythropolis]
MTSPIISRKIILPDFFCPIPPEIHRGVAEFDAATMSWVDDMGIASDPAHRNKLHGNNCAEFYSRITPNGTIEGIQLAVDWHSWAFSFDDVYCDQDSERKKVGHFVALACQTLRTLQAPEAALLPENAHNNGIRDLARRYHALATPTQLYRWVDCHRQWFMGTAWMMLARENHTVPDPNSYLAMRLKDSGGETVTAMIEVANAGEIPERELHAPATEALTELTHMIAILDNELVSRYKEAYNQQGDLTFIDSLVTHGRMSHDHAELEAISIRDRMMEHFLYLQERELHRKSLSAQLSTYLECLGSLIRGNIDWSLKCPRYTKLYEPGQNNPTSELAFQASIGTGASPLTVDLQKFPAVAWWWNV